MIEYTFKLPSVGGYIAHNPKNIYTHTKNIFWYTCTLCDRMALRYPVIRHGATPSNMRYFTTPHMTTARLTSTAIYLTF